MVSMCKGSPAHRIAMAAVKAFVVAFGTQVVAQVNAGADIQTATGWKTIVISAAAAGGLAVWKVLDIVVESKG